MKLEEIHNEVLNEVAKGPLAAFEFILKGAGKGMAEANGALLTAVQKINPSVKQLFRATDEEISRALLRTEFKEYRQIIAKSIIANKEREIDLILKSSDLTTTQGIRQAKANIANRLGVKNAFANDIVNLKIPKISGTPRVTPFVQNTDELWSFFSNEMRTFNIMKKLNPNQSKFFIDEMMSLVEKEIGKSGGKIEVRLNNLKNQYDKIKSPIKRKELLERANKEIYDLGAKKNWSQKTKELMSNSLKDFLKEPKANGEKLKILIIASTVTSLILDIIRAYDDDKKFEGHFGFTFLKTAGLKTLAYWASTIVFKLNIFGAIISVAQVLDSIIRFIPYLFGDQVNPTLKQKAKTSLKNGEKYVDSLKQEYTPKLDSLNQEYRPKIDSTLQSLKNKLNTQPSGLDSTGKTQIIDPFK